MNGLVGSMATTATVRSSARNAVTSTTAKQVPAGILDTVQRWHAGDSAVRLEEAALLRVEQPKVLTHLRHDARARLDDGYWHDAITLVPDLGHAELLAQHSLDVLSHDCRFLAGSKA